MKKIIAQFDLPNVTSQQYDQVVKDLEAAGQGTPSARLYHVAAQAPKGWFVVDVWESEETLNEFAETLVPILAKNGITPPQPVVFPVHNIIML